MPWEAVAALRHAVPVHALLHKRHAGKVTIAPVIRSCWHGGVEELKAFTQIGAKSVNIPRQQAIILSSSCSVVCHLV